jgi:hypothetical protein
VLLQRDDARPRSGVERDCLPSVFDLTPDRGALIFREVFERRARPVHDQHGGVLEAGGREGADGVAEMVRDAERRHPPARAAERRVRLEVLSRVARAPLKTHDGEAQVVRGDARVVEAVL